MTSVGDVRGRGPALRFPRAGAGRGDRSPVASLGAELGHLGLSLGRAATCSSSAVALELLHGFRFPFLASPWVLERAFYCIPSLDKITHPGEKALVLRQICPLFTSV